jgi:hypothetical protein
MLVPATGSAQTQLSKRAAGEVLHKSHPPLGPMDVDVLC